MVICHHENDMQLYVDHYGDKIKFYHIAHCAEASIFKQLNTPKQYDVLLVGALSLLELVIFSILLLAEAPVLTPTLLSPDLSDLLTETVTLTFPEFLL